MSSRDLNLLNPAFKSKAFAFLAAANKAGLDVLVYCTVRTFEEQDMLFAQGRTVPGKLVTKARAGESAHNYGLAFDGAPLIGGRIAWNDHPHWLLYGKIAADVGLEWAGNWVLFQEYPHIQLPHWQQFKTLQET